METSNRLSWSDYVTQYKEASDLENQLQGDVADIESASAATVLQGWEDLSSAIYNNPNWADLLKGSNGTFIKGYLQNIQSNAETFLSNETLQVAQPNNPGGYINLYAGDVQSDGDGGFYNDFDETDDEGDPIPANMLEMIEGKYTNLVNDGGDAYFDVGMSGDPWYEHMGGQSVCPWAYGGLNYNISWDDSGDGGGNCYASGSLQQWAPFIHPTGGDPSALNASLQG